MPYLRASLLLCIHGAITSGCVTPERAERPKSAERLPNFVVLFADDLGYGDLGCYGHPTLRTPNLDRMASQGLRFSQFYSAAPVCTPSRAALLTGRLPIRSGMCAKRPRVLTPTSLGGLPAEEVTLAEALKTRGYATACIGKWHLGHLPQHLPGNHGFDEYFGLPYSNDMDRVADAPKRRLAYAKPKSEYWNLPLIRNRKVIERPADQVTLTRRYTEEAMKFIEAHRSGPFFLYLPYTMPHVPLFASKDFRGRSRRGFYGDALEEIDWSVGQVLSTLERLGLAQDTLAFFTSDNGPWLSYGVQGGSAGLLRSGKGSTWEGGMREPCIAWWPGSIANPGRVTKEMGSTMDIFSTCLALAGVAPPTDRIIDGVDLSPVLLGRGKSPRETMFYYRGTELYALRKGRYKAHFITKQAYGRDQAKRHDPPILHQLEHDPSEKHDVAKAHPEVLADIVNEASRHKARLAPGKCQLLARSKAK